VAVWGTARPSESVMVSNYPSKLTSAGVQPGTGVGVLCGHDPIRGGVQGGVDNGPYIQN